MDRKKYIEMFGSFTEPFNCVRCYQIHYYYYYYYY